MNKRKDIWSYLTVLTFVLYAILLIFPLIMLLKSSVQYGDNSFSLHYFQKFFGKQYYMDALWNSVKVTVAVTFFSVIIAVPLAYFLTTLKMKGKNLIQILIVVSSVSPPFIGAYSWILLLGRNGAITNFIKNTFGLLTPDIYGFGGIVLVMSLQLFPLIFIYSMGVFKNIDNSLIEAAESMGCTGLKKMFKVIMPLITPTILAGSLLVFMRTLSDFGTPMLIGKGYRTIPVLIYNEFISEVGGEAGFAAAISILVVIVTTLIFMAQQYIQKKKSFTMNTLHPIQVKDVQFRKKIFPVSYIYFILFLALIPRIYVIYTSFLATKGQIFTNQFSLESYSMAFKKLGSSIQTTFYLAIVSMVVIILFSIIIAYITVRRSNKITKIIDIVSMFPLLVPGSVLGIAMATSFNNKPLLLSGTALILIISFSIRRMPYTIRSSSAALEQSSVSVEEAAISLGASKIKTFAKVVLPMMISGVISGAILSWINIFSELSTSIILYTARTKTISVAIYTEVMRGNFGVAAALSTILTIIMIVSLLIFFKVTGNKELSM